MMRASLQQEVCYCLTWKASTNRVYDPVAQWPLNQVDSGQQKVQA
jgi:hypothetical protein